MSHVSLPGAPRAIVDVPGPRPADMLAAAPRMIRDPLGYLTAVRDRYGPVVSFPLPRTAVLLLDDPAAARHVLVDNHRGYSKRTVQYDTLALVTGQGLLVSDPPVWLRNRRLVQPAFHHEQLPAVVDHAAAAAGRVLAGLAGLRDGALVDVDALMMRASLEVVGGALFGTDLSGSASRLVAATLAALHQVVVRARSPWLPPLGVPTPGNVRLRRALRVLDDAVAAMVARRRSAGGPADDLLGLLLRAQAQQADVEPLDDAAVRDEVVTLLIAGHETVASALSWTWWLLAEHPDVADRLATEVHDVLGDRPAPGWADLLSLPLTRAVVDEGLRLYPPAWVLTRRALADDVVAGVAVPRGSLLLISPYTLHRNPAVWADPDRFDPARWLGSRRTEHVKGGYLPFGAGPRLCIGRDFALVESVVLLATLARRLRFAAPPGPPPRVDALVTLRPRGGLPMQVVRRRGCPPPSVG